MYEFQNFPYSKFNIFLGVFVCECAMISALILGGGGGGGHKVRGKENCQNSINSILLGFLLFAIIFVR